MEISKKPLPPVQPEYTYDITGLTEEEAAFLRDLVGKFSCSGGTHFHSKLYVKLERSVGHRSLSDRRFDFTTYDNGDMIPVIVLQCKKLDKN